MRIRLRPPLVFTCIAAVSFTVNGVAQAPQPPDVPARLALASPAPAYQGRGPEQTERFSRKVKLGREGTVTISNLSGDIVVTGGAGDEVSIEAVKRTRGERARLADARIEVNERPGRVDIRTLHAGDRTSVWWGRSDRVSIDYTITVPVAASVEAHAISGDSKVTGVRGAVRVEAVSGNVTAAETPRLELAKSVSGDVELGNVAAEGDLSVGTVSGNLHVKGLKTRGLDVSTVSGDLTLDGVTCERLTAKSVSGSVEFTGTLSRNGRIDVNSHSGDVRLMLSGLTGFELTANTFSGSIRSELPLTIGAETGAAGRPARPDSRRERSGANSRSIRATYGDGSAVLSIRTFSGNITLTNAK